MTGDPQHRCPTCGQWADVEEEHEEQVGYEEQARPIWVIDLSCGHSIEIRLRAAGYGNEQT